MPLLPANYEIADLIGKVGAGLITVDAFGGAHVNYQLIETMFRIYHIPEERQPELFEKFQVYIDVMLEYIKEKRNG